MRPGAPLILAASLLLSGASLSGQESEIAGCFPIVGSTQGAFESAFRTELQLNNRSSRLMSGWLVFRPAGTVATEHDPPIRYEIEPHSTLRISDVVSELSATGIGSLDLRVDEGSVPTMVTRVFDDKGAEGTAGAMIPFIPLDDSLDRGDRAVLLVPADLERTRFNIGVRSLGTSATIRMTVWSANGIEQRSSTRTYPANYFIQESGEDFAGGVLLSNEAVEIEVLEGRVTLYGTTTDNQTNDPSIALATPVPAAVE